MDSKDSQWAQANYPAAVQYTRATWKPTAQQQKMLECAKEVGYCRDMAQVCALANIPLGKLHHWLRSDPDFVAAWHQIPKSSMRFHLSAVAAAMIAKAVAGDVPAARLIFDVLGEVGPQRLKIEGNVNVNLIDIIYATAERAKQLQSPASTDAESEAIDLVPVESDDE